MTDENGERPPGKGACRPYAAFVERHCKDDLLAVLRGELPDAPYAVPVNFLQLAEHSPQSAALLLEKPNEVLADLEVEMMAAQDVLAEGPMAEQGMSVKDIVRPRLMGLPQGLDPPLGSIRAMHAGRLVAIRGTIARAGAVKVLESLRTYECSKCGHQFCVAVDVEAGATVVPPSLCPNDRMKPCKGKTFRHVAEEQRHTDFQEGRDLAVGAAPRSITVILQDELVDTCKPGGTLDRLLYKAPQCAADEVVVTAVVARQWRPCYPGARCELEVVFMANNLALLNSRKASVQVTAESVEKFEAFWREHEGDELAGRASILNGLCPQIHGMPLVKLATLVMLVGGCQRKDETGARIRGQIHMLIVGDPGTGKSQFLKYAAKLSSRAVVTSGKASSAAGLTATAVREDDHWALEAGALVLADGGICCIDEFDGLREGVRATIHEAMEQQTISVAKAGMMATLNTRTTVFGVCNPKGTYDPRVSLSVNTSLSGPLLSRFDITLVLQDLKNQEWDARVADHILNGCLPTERDVDEGVWSLDTLQQYICYVQRLQPCMTPQAEQILLRYYQVQRGASGRDAARTTVRMFESLIRIAQAHARLMAREEVRSLDALVAVMLIDTSMEGTALMQCNPMLHRLEDDPSMDFLAGQLSK